MVVLRILGSTRKHSELTPIISMASICSVILILPSSDAILDPILPASMSATMVEQNSRMRLSLTMYPTYILSINGFSRLDAVCITRTPPIKSEMMPTIDIDDIMSLSLSLMNCFQNKENFSGLENTLFRNIK